MAGMMSGLASAGEVDAADPVDIGSWTSDMSGHVGRVTRSATGLALPGDLAEIAHLRQFMELFTSFGDRFFDPALWTGLVGNDDEERDRMSERLAAATKLLRFADTEAQFIHHQRGALRRVAMEFREFERRHNLMLAYPDYPTARITPDANAVFFSGSGAVEDLVLHACGILGMDLTPAQQAGTRTEGRWQQLRASGVAVFDHTAYDPGVMASMDATADPAAADSRLLEQAGAVASVAFETGWAHALGSAVLVVTTKGTPAPFDIDVETVALGADGRDADRVLAGLQAAIYGLQRGATHGGVDEVLRHARSRYAASPDETVRAMLDRVSGSQAATAVRRTLGALVDRLPGQKPLLLVPAFPGVHQPDGPGHVFHATGFRDWARPCQDETRRACERAGIEYRIGFESLDPQILRSVWSDICSAAFVVADITHLNPNAVLELGIAAAVGRPTLILTRNRNVHACFPPVEKVRVHHYDPDRGTAQLSALLDTFLGGENPTHLAG